MSNNQKDAERWKITIEKQEETKWQQILSNKTQEIESKWQTRINELEHKLKKEASLEIDALKKEL